MGRFCLVKGCKSKNINEFVFPTDEHYRREWLKALRKHQNIGPHLDGKLVCYLHFNETDYIILRRQKRCLNPGAIPSIFPSADDEDYIISDSSDAANTGNYQDPNTDSFNRMDDDENDYETSKNKSESDFEPDSDDLEEEDSGDDDDEANGDEEDSDNSIRHVDTVLNEMIPDGFFKKSRPKLEKKTENSSEGSEHELIFKEFDDNVDEIDSDYEPVTETEKFLLRKKISKKSIILVNINSKLNCLEERLKNSLDHIKKLNAELLDYAKYEETTLTDNSDRNNSADVEIIDENNRNEQSGAHSQDKHANIIFPKANLNHIELQRFALALHNFSPNVFTYLSSIIPYLPSLEMVLEWIESGYATTIFPNGALTERKKVNN